MRFSRAGIPVIVSVVVSVGLSGYADLPKRYVSQQNLYSVSYPSAWRFAGDESTFEIYSFPGSRAVKGIVLPEGGAGISIFTPAALKLSGDSAPHSLAEWIKRVTAHQSITGRRAFELRNQGGTVHIVEIQAECCGDSRIKIESFQWFFELGGRLFCASGGHRKGDPNTDDLLRTLEDVVGTLRLLR